MMTERPDACFQNQSCVDTSNCLSFFCGSFRHSAHESCIKGANNVRGGVLKSTLVVDNDNVHSQHAFSPTVISVFSHSSTDARSAWLKKKIHAILWHTVTIFHQILVFFLKKKICFGRKVALTSSLPRALARDRAMLATEEMHVRHVIHSSRMAALGPGSQHRHRPTQLK